MDNNQQKNKEEIKKTILAVDDEEAILDLLKFHIEKEGYKFVSANDGEEGIRKTFEENPDLIILDVMLPKIDGLTICRRIRQRGSNVPIIMLSAKGEEVDKIIGLEIGADDYITKPFSTRELLARIKANLRKTDGVEGVGEYRKNNKIHIGDFTVDIDKVEVTVNGKIITALTRREFEVVKFLAERPGQVISREVLLEKVWGYEYYGDIRTVDVTVRRIREKIEEDTSNPQILVTKRGVGYFIATRTGEEKEKECKSVNEQRNREMSYKAPNINIDHDKLVVKDKKKEEPKKEEKKPKKNIIK